MSGYYTPGFPNPTANSTTFPFTGNEKIGADTYLPSGEAPQTIAPTFSQLGSYLGGKTPFVASRFYGLPQGATPVALLTVTATLYAYPLYIPATSVATFNIGCTTGQTGGACRRRR